jgi:hypothetical protein
MIRSLATDYLGYVDPDINEFRQGEARSGEVAGHPKGPRPVPTVDVSGRQDGATSPLTTGIQTCGDDGEIRPTGSTLGLAKPTVPTGP